MDGLRLGIVAAAVTLAWAGLANAQAAAPAGHPGQAGPGQRAQQIQARFQIAAMEAVLERAVQLGAQKTRAQVQAVAPDLLFITGAARARGFWLDGYGVFFDVDVPAMRRSLAWSFRMLDQNDRGLDVALESFKRKVAAIGDPAVRRDLQQTLQQIEREVGPPSSLAAAGDAGVRTAARDGEASPLTEAGQRGEQPPVLEDPGLAYTNEVKNALIDAMIEYGSPLLIPPDDWVTIAARDQEGSRLQPGDPYDVSTLLLRIRGADLAAYRAGQIDREETRRRVEVKEY